MPVSSWKSGDGDEIRFFLFSFPFSFLSWFCLHLHINATFSFSYFPAIETGLIFYTSISSQNFEWHE